MTASRLAPQGQGSTIVSTTAKSGDNGVRNDSKHKATAQTSVLGLLIPSVLSGLVCGLIIFVFCCVFSSMIFQQPGFPAVLESAVPLGVGMHTVSTMAGALVFAKLSACKAGPDLNPVVFIAEGTGDRRVDVPRRHMPSRHG